MATSTISMSLFLKVVTEKEQPADMGVLVWFFIGLYSNILKNAPPDTHT